VIDHSSIVIAPDVVNTKKPEASASLGELLSQRSKKGWKMKKENAAQKSNANAGS
jgi:hypothetical protein